MGGVLVNYFNQFGRQWQVYVQAEGDYRTKAENVGQFYVTNDAGQPVPMSALTTVKPSAGPEFTMRYNLFRCVQLNGNAAPGYSSSQAMKALEEVFAVEKLHHDERLIAFDTVVENLHYVSATQLRRSARFTLKSCPRVFLFRELRIDELDRYLGAECQMLSDPDGRLRPPPNRFDQAVPRGEDLTLVDHRDFRAIMNRADSLGTTPETQGPI